MVKDWGMSEKVGLRTIEGPKGLMASETLGGSAIELVIKKSIKIFINEQKCNFIISFRLTQK